MKYMEQHFDLRTDPTKLVPGAKSVISLLYNYYQNQSSLDKTIPKIAKYALGDDYHFIIKEKLYELLHTIQCSIGDVSARVFVDSGPVLEQPGRHKVVWVGSEKTGT